MAKDLFKEIIPSIMSNKEYALEDDKDYVPFVVNKALSFHRDTFMDAVRMNGLYGLDRRLQYDYMFFSVRKANRRFVPWMKPHKSEDIELLKRHFGYSHRRAVEALTILTKEQVSALHKLYEPTKS